MKTTLQFITLTILLTVSFSAFATTGEKKAVLQEDISKVWPLKEIELIEYELTMARLEFCKNDNEREEYLREYESFVKQKYLGLVLGLNLRQGKLLLLLIHRELGQTPFDLIKLYLSYRKARFWQNIAKLAGTDLKAEYTSEKYPDIEQSINNFNRRSIGVNSHIKFRDFN
jgi:hypothetical protein